MRRLIVVAALAVAAAVGIASAGRSDPGVTAETAQLDQVVGSADYGVIFSPPANPSPRVSAGEALAAAATVMGQQARPARLVAILASRNGVDEWIVSYVGGNTCAPLHGASAENVEPKCIGNVWDVVVDATDASFVDRYASAVPVSEGEVSNLPVDLTVPELLEGHAGKA